VFILRAARICPLPAFWRLYMHALLAFGRCVRMPFKNTNREWFSAVLKKDKDP